MLRRIQYARIGICNHVWLTAIIQTDLFSITVKNRHRRIRFFPHFLKLTSQRAILIHPYHLKRLGNIQIPVFIRSLIHFHPRRNIHKFQILSRITVFCKKRSCQRKQQKQKNNYKSCYRRRLTPEPKPYISRKRPVLFP